MEKVKHYLSICNSAPSERLALIALNNRERILARNCQIIDENLVELNAFFARHPELFEWRISDGSCMAFPRYLGADGVELFTQRLVEESGVLLLPGSIYASSLTPTPTDRFRIGFGRTGIDEGLIAMDDYLS
jgi:aspartate/methionine/tyrosine aminotransferase